MIKTLFLLFTLLGSSFVALASDIHTLRGMMGAAYTNETSAKKFYNDTRSYSSKSGATLLGFKAIAELMMCKHLLNPLNKLSYFNKGKKNLEQAISLENNNPELRFMRYCTQVNAPNMLGYNTDINTDKAFLIEYLKAQKNAHPKKDEALYLNVKKFLLENKYCSNAEKKLIQQL